MHHVYVKYIGYSQIHVVCVVNGNEYLTYDIVCVIGVKAYKINAETMGFYGDYHFFKLFGTLDVRSGLLTF